VHKSIEFNHCTRFSIWNRWLGENQEIYSHGSSDRNCPGIIRTTRLGNSTSALSTSWGGSGTGLLPPGWVPPDWAFLSGDEADRALGGSCTWTVEKSTPGSSSGRGMALGGCPNTWTPSSPCNEGVRQSILQLTALSDGMVQLHNVLAMQLFLGNRTTYSKINWLACVLCLSVRGFSCAVRY